MGRTHSHSVGAAPKSGEPGLLCSDRIDVSQRFWDIGCDAGGGPETPPDSVSCPSERPAAARGATEAAWELFGGCAPAVDDALVRGMLDTPWPLQGC